MPEFIEEPEHVGTIVDDHVVCSCGGFKSRKIGAAATYQWNAFRNHVTEEEQKAGRASSSESEREEQS